MQLYLVQHGAAKSEAEDPQRSLTTQGTRMVQRMAQYLSQVMSELKRSLAKDTSVKQVVRVVLGGLKRLEYRKYASAGIAVAGIGSGLQVRRAAG